MTNIGSGEIISDLRKRIQEIQIEIDQLGKPVSDMPELIESANLLRSNVYLSKTNDKKSELLDAYSQYSKSLEDLLSYVFDIQKDLKDILKEQSGLISSSKKTAKPKTKPKKK